MIKKSVLTMMAFGLCCGIAAQAKPQQAVRERATTDLFGENQRRIGLLVGPQLSGYTPIEDASPVSSFQSSMRGMVGVSFELVYSIPIVEFEVIGNLRGGLNNDSTYFSLAYPLLVKIPIAVDDEIGFDFGGGIQPESLLAGNTPRRTLLFGAVALAGISFHEVGYFIGLEARYVHGFQSVLPDTSGTKPRDGALLVRVGLPL